VLNRYPLWKYLMVAFIVIIGTLYSAPNLYGEDPALQISAARGHDVQVNTLTAVEKTLDDAKITIKKATLDKGQVLIRFKNTEDQLRARELVAQSLGDDFITALNLAPATPAWLQSIGANPLKLGLDLRGGVHFLMEVDMKEAVDKSMEQYVQGFRSELRDENIRYAGVRRSGMDILVTFRDSDNQQKGLAFMRRHHADLAFTDSQDNDRYIVKATVTDTKLAAIKEDAVEQNITIIRNRVNELGVAEPLVQRQGDSHIVIELPGIQDTARAKEILGATATLEFRLVDENADPASAVNGQVPANSQLFYDRNHRPVVLQKHVILTGDHITGSDSGSDEYARPQVSIRLDGVGGNRMSEVSKDNIGKAMASVYIEYKPEGTPGPDGKRQMKKFEQVINVATIQSRLGSDFRITGIDTPQEAHNLSLLLRSGALTAPIQIVEERTIGPSMGQANIDSGLEALGVGTLILVVFMLVYYKLFGLVADIALIFNLVLLVGVMSLIPGATMTLPGIAGIVLTLGMAVDANVLIYERIREEIEEGRSMQQSIHLGYERAFGTILDSNVTTLITAVILFAVGTGSVRGFALVLMIGILCSMFTAIVGSRAIVNLVWGGRKKLDKLPI
jgi:preprotein translocase subunit SecD